MYIAFKKELQNYKMIVEADCAMFVKFCNMENWNWLERSNDFHFNDNQDILSAMIIQC